MERSKILTIVGLVLAFVYFLPMRKLDYGFFTIHSALPLYYSVVIILSIYKMRHIPLEWNLVASACFTLLSMDYWELPFGWYEMLDIDPLYFTLRWRLFPVIYPFMIMIILFKYKWNFKKYLALALPAYLAVTLYPLIINTWGELWFFTLPIIGHVDSGPLRYMPNRIISTIALGWVMLNGEPSTLFKKLIRLTRRKAPTFS